MRFDRHRSTPWARAHLTPGMALAIQEAEPADATVALGVSGGWTCRIYLDDRLVGEAYHGATEGQAFRAACEDMNRRAAA